MEAKIPPNVKLSEWKVYCNILPTRVNQGQRKMVVEVVCLQCWGHEEDAFVCSFSVHGQDEFGKYGENIVKV